MWCPKCQQDVPAIAASGEVACCARCGQSIADDAHHEGLADMAARGIELSDAWVASKGGVNDRVLSSGDWLLDDAMHHLRRRVGTGGAATTPSESAALAMPAAGNMAGAGSMQTSFEQHLRQYSDGPPTARRPSLIAWGTLSLGLMAFVCGGVLLAWSFIAGRNDLWNIGMPATLIGQFGLLLGLVLQLDHLWQANRRTAETLEDVDQRLHEINHATTMLRTTHSAPAQSFYAHLAEGANPQLLLADLKGQLDLLAMKMAAKR